MSRRAQTTDTTERNRNALKTLTKLETNKMCADCKRNKHPRWASWNLGVFVCIRCSGIHRSLGVHISKVKSIDLDSWTDEQLSSVVRWGNKRANKYWEHKLAEGHVPNDGKMESFIRTKYDSKRWAMDGPVPDPATLDDGEENGNDDDVPLKVVQERARGNSIRNGNAAASGSALQAPRTRPQDVDLFGDPSGPAMARPNTAEPAMSRTGPPKAQAAPPKQTRPGESLLGLDFFGGAQSAPPQRPSSTSAATPGQTGRTDLKQSILSLYASKPAPPPVQQQQQQQPVSNASFFGDMQSTPPTSNMQQSSNNQSFGGLGDAFSTLSFSSPQQSSAPKPAQPSYSNFTSPPSHTRQPSSNKPNPLSGGSFFDTKPAPPPKATSPQTSRKESFGGFSGDFGDFSSATQSPPSTTKSPPMPTSSNHISDMFGAMPAAASAPLAKSTTTASMTAKSPPPIQASNYANTSKTFNLSSPTTTQPPKPVSAANQFSNLSQMDAGWGSNDNAWATPDPTPAPAPAPTRAQPTFVSPPQQPSVSSYKPTPASSKVESPFDAGWGDPEPTAAPAKPTATSSGSGGGFGQSSGGFGGQSTSGGGFSVQQDEEFGGWSHASPVAQTPGPRQGGGSGTGGGDDLFGNVWG
ncbi:ARF GAP with effector function(s) [Elasticomyces elasticus]|nr:ARF GAP with effector function(s) [Elasticomyces elasticus]